LGYRLDIDEEEEFNRQQSKDGAEKSPLLCCDSPSPSSGYSSDPTDPDLENNNSQHRNIYNTKISSVSPKKKNVIASFLFLFIKFDLRYFSKGSKKKGL
jgi:hypothetical protein